MLRNWKSTHWWQTGCSLGTKKPPCYDQHCKMVLPALRGFTLHYLQGKWFRRSKTVSALQDCGCELSQRPNWNDIWVIAHDRIGLLIDIELFGTFWVFVFVVEGVRGVTRLEAERGRMRTDAAPSIQQWEEFGQQIIPILYRSEHLWGMSAWHKRYCSCRVISKELSCSKKSQRDLVDFCHLHEKDSSYVLLLQSVTDL